MKALNLGNGEYAAMALDREYHTCFSHTSQRDKSVSIGPFRALMHPPALHDTSGIASIRRLHSSGVARLAAKLRRSLLQLRGRPLAPERGDAQYYPFSWLERDHSEEKHLPLMMVVRLADVVKQNMFSERHDVHFIQENPCLDPSYFVSFVLPCMYSSQCL